ncbi:hypothetical protein [Paenibacillus agricola]|nr:hypothetical protein [Paenibacillus agricola]
MRTFTKSSALLIMTLPGLILLIAFHYLPIGEDVPDHDFIALFSVLDCS